MAYSFDEVATPALSLSAYASGDAMGTSLSWVPRSASATGKIDRLLLKSLDSVGVTLTMLFFRGAISNTTVTDNAAFSLNAADRPLYLGYCEIASGDWKNHSSIAGLYVADKALAMRFKLNQAERELVGVLIAGGAHTASAAGAITAALGGEVDF